MIMIMRMVGGLGSKAGRGIFDDVGGVDDVVDDDVHDVINNDHTYVDLGLIN